LASSEQRRYSNEAKMQNALKFAGVPQTRQPISVSGSKFTMLWRHLEEILLLNKFFPIVDTCRSFKPCPCSPVARQDSSPPGLTQWACYKKASAYGSRVCWALAQRIHTYIHAVVAKTEPDNVVQWCAAGDFFATCIFIEPRAAHFRHAF